MIMITGKITRGMGGATTSVGYQMLHFVKERPELARCKRATINVRLDCQLDIISPDFMIGPLHWHPDLRAMPELFGFVKLLKFESVNPSVATDEARIYIPYNSGHRLNPYSVEILAPELKLAGAIDCKLYISGKRVIT